MADVDGRVKPAALRLALDLLKDHLGELPLVRNILSLQVFAYFLY